MGNCTSASTAQTIKVIFPEQTGTLQERTYKKCPFDHLQDKIANDFTDLRGMDYTMMLPDSSQLTSSNYLSAFRDTDQIEIVVAAIQNHKFHSTLDVTAQQIVKLYSKKWKDIVSTGVFVSDRHVLTFYSIGKESLDNFEIILHNHRRWSIAKNSSEVVISQVGLLIFEVTDIDDEMIDPVKITQKKFESDSFPANAIYFSAGCNRIFGKEKLNIKNFNEKEYMTDAVLSAGAIGAPLFKRQEGPIDKWDFIGIVKEMQSNSMNIIKSTEIHKSLSDCFEEQNKNSKKTIKHVIGEIKEKEKINAIDEVEIVEGNTQDYTKIAVYIQTRKIIELGPRTTSRREFNIGLDFGAGYSVIGCSLGAMITGGSNLRKGAHVWQKQIMNQMPNMQEARENHTSIIFDGNVVVIGGSDKTCEMFDIKTTQWSSFADTVMERTNATAVAYSGSIFLFGGYNASKQKYQNSIEQYISGQWTLIGAEFTLPMPLSNAGGIRLDDDKIMIFGGRSTDGVNDSSVLVDIQTKSSEVVGKLPFSGQFASFAPIQAETEFFMYSSDGSAMSYNLRRKKFYDLRVS